MGKVYKGFPKESVRFMAELRANNDRDWFEAHRADYDAFFVGAGQAFVEAAGEALQTIAPRVQAIPKIDGSIFRLHRDTRFSADKRPYKDHLDMWFWEGPKKQAASGFLFRLTADGWGVGVGAVKPFDKHRLERFRSAVVADKSGKALLAADKACAKAGVELAGAHYKRPPRGFEASGRAAELLRHNSLYAIREGPQPKSLHSAKLISECMKTWQPLLGLHRWLVDNLQD
jgi:uncharacterized protein (TIGR02453 family)